MNTRKKLGKITRIEFGRCPDRGGLGLFYTLSGEGWGVDASRVYIGKGYLECMGDVGSYIVDLLDTAKVNYISQLKGKPVEATFEGNKLISWRILKEVL